MLLINAVVFKTFEIFANSVRYAMNVASNFCSQLIGEQEKTLSHLESVEKAYLELLQRSEQMKVGIGNYKVGLRYLNLLSLYLRYYLEAPNPGMSYWPTFLTRGPFRKMQSLPEAALQIVTGTSIQK